MKQLAVLIVLAVASVGLCADPKAPKTDKALNGMWTPESAVMAGKEVPREALKSMELVRAYGKYSLKHGEQVGEGTCQRSTNRMRWPQNDYLCCHKWSTQRQDHARHLRTGKGDVKDLLRHDR